MNFSRSIFKREPISFSPRGIFLEVIFEQNFPFLFIYFFFFIYQFYDKLRTNIFIPGDIRISFLMVKKAFPLEIKMNLRKNYDPYETKYYSFTLLSNIDLKKKKRGVLLSNYRGILEGGNEIVCFSITSLLFNFAHLNTCNF